MTTLLESALNYSKQGWNVIPLHWPEDGKCSCGREDCASPGKHPLTTHGLKDRSTDIAQITQWWEKWPKANIAICTGEVSGLIVLDADGVDGKRTLEKKLVDGEPPVVKTGKGIHVYLKHPGGEVKNLVRKMPGLDLRGDEGYVVAPPSLHISGRVYEWATPYTNKPTYPPGWLLELLDETKELGPAPPVEAILPEGERNNTLFSLAGTMRRRGMEHGEILAALLEVNQKRCTPPMASFEVENLVKNITRYDPQVFLTKKYLYTSTETNNGELTPPAIHLPHISEIENPRNLNRLVQADAIVSSTSRAYAIPKRIEAQWYDSEGAQHKKKKAIPPNDSVNMMLAGVTSTTKHKILAGLFPSATRRVSITDLEYRTVYTLNVRPPIFTLEKQGDKIVDEKGYEYKAYRVYVVSEKQLSFPASNLMTLRGIPLPDPKTQITTLLVTDIKFPDSVKHYDESRIVELSAVYEGKTPQERMEWVLENLEKYSKIIGRKNIAEAILLGYFTPTWIQLNGETQRGWCNILVLGDTTTGKTETLRKVIRLLKAGALITAETASSVGLVGAATQTTEGWSVDWGFLVLNDRRLLGVDGAHKLRKSQWGALAESERSGIVTIAKAAKDSAYARTRQIKIANPLDPQSDKYESKSLSGFYYQAQASATFLDLMSVARLDLCVFADSEDVRPEDINKRFESEHDPRLELLSEVLKWMWSGQIAIIFTPEAEDLLLEKATELYNKFFCKSVPLASIDLKWKIARLSAALAAITLSTEDYRTLYVTKEHVEWIVDLFVEEYTQAGLHSLHEKMMHDSIDEEEAQEIIEIVMLTLDETQPEKIVSMLDWIALKGRFTKSELKSKFNLARDNKLQPLLNYLSTEELIRRGSGFYATTKLVKMCRLSTISTFRMVKPDTPPKIPAGGQQRL